MLNIDELKERIRLEVLSRSGQLPPSIETVVPHSQPPEPLPFARLRRIAERLHCEFALRFVGWLLRPWRGYRSLHADMQRWEQRLAGLEPRFVTLEQLITGEIDSRSQDLIKINQEFHDLQRDMVLTRQANILRGYELNRLMDDLKADGRLTEDEKQVLADHADDRLETYLLAFADACRGDERDIRRDLTVYLDYLDKSGAGVVDAPVLDLGSGRGEWLGLLRDRYLIGSGVDRARAMVDHCLDAGLKVERSDALDALRNKEIDSLGAITAFHLIEHLPFPLLYRLFEESYRTLRPGGIIIFETPNPENPLVGSHTFYHDPTHRNPLTPSGMEFMARYHGFVSIEILRLHPYPDSARLEGKDLLTERINALLCGYQDFALIAVKP